MKPNMSPIFVSLVMCYIFANVTAKVKLTTQSNIYLPAPLRTPQVALFADSVETLTYDVNTKFVYVAGKEVIHVVDISDVRKPEVLLTRSLPGRDVTDIELCDDVIFLAWANLTDLGLGYLDVYKVYNRSTGAMDRLHTVEVGAVPDMLQPRPHCRSVVIAQEGEAYRNAQNQNIDPEGSVVIVKFPKGPTSTDAPMVTRLDFRRFDDVIESYFPGGVRFVSRDNGNKFSNDVEPEFVALDEHGEKAYVCLQENNAIAEIDLQREEITQLHGLGYKQFGHLDASDRDGGIRITYWPIRGWYQPDAIKFHQWEGRRLVFTANEGDVKNGDIEEIRGKDIDQSKVGDSIPRFVKHALRNDSLLGRLKFASQDGKDSEGIYQSLYTFGGRSFSIWDASSSMAQIYDSGSTMSEMTALHCPHLYNTNAGRNNETDGRSDDNGACPESLAIAEEGNRLYVFVGNERPGTVMVYSIGRDLSDVRFETIYCDGNPDDSRTADQKFSARELYAVDPEDIKYVPRHKSPSGSPLLLVGGAVSGTLTVVQVDVMPEPGDLMTTSHNCLGDNYHDVRDMATSTVASVLTVTVATLLVSVVTRW